MRATTASIHSAGGEMDAPPAILSENWADLGQLVLRRIETDGGDTAQLYREAIEEWLEQAESAAAGDSR